MKKVSFDFDGTLSRPIVQAYAKELISKGVEVWVCTSRFDNLHAPNINWNDDLFKVIHEVGINRKNLIFTNYIDKWEVLKDFDFIWHLDDDWIELKLINKHTNIKALSVFGNSVWKNKCNRFLK